MGVLYRGVEDERSEILEPELKVRELIEHARRTSREEPAGGCMTIMSLGGQDGGQWELQRPTSGLIEVRVNRSWGPG